MTTEILMIIGWIISAILAYIVGEKQHITQRKKEKIEKFENAIAKWRLEYKELHSKSMKNGKMIDNNVYEDFWLLWYDREKYIQWLKDNDITEVKDFQKWLETKNEDFKTKRYSYD